MTVTTTAASAGPYVANGSTTVFPFSFVALSTTELQVARQSATTGAWTVLGGYTVSLNANQATDPGGSVTFSVAPVAGDPLFILSDPDFAQQANFANQGSWSPTAVNIAFDRSDVRAIRLLSDAERAIKVPLGETATALPSAANRADKVVAFDASGNIYAPDVSAQNLETLAGISSQIVTVAARDADIGTVAGNLTGTNTIGTVAGSITNVNAVGGSITQVLSVAADLTNINALAGDLTNINTVAGSIANVNLTGGSIANVNTVAGAVANVNTTATNITNVNAVGGSITNVNTVATNITGVNTTATNIAAILDAPNQAASAAASATAYPDVAAAVGPDLLSGVSGSTIGSTTPNTSTAPVGQAYANDTPTSNAQILQTVSVRLSATGTGNVEIVAPVNGVQTILTIVPVTVTTIPQTFTMPANTVLPKNGRVFYRRLTGGTLRYVLSSTPLQVNYTDADAADNQVTLASGASTMALSYTARAAALSLADRVTANESLTAELKNYQYSLGKEVTPVLGNGGNSAANTWIFALPNARGGLLRVQAFGWTAGGTMKVRRFSRSGSTYTQVGSDILVTVPVNGLVTFETGVTVNAGEYLGFYAPINCLSFTSTDTGSNGGRLTGTGDQTTITSSTKTTSGAFQIRFDVASAQLVADVNSRLSEVENEVYTTVAGNPDALAAGNGGLIAANTFAFYDPIERGGRLRVRVRGGPGQSGSFPVRRFSRSGDTYTQVGSDIFVPVQMGQVTVFDTGVTVNAGEFLGFSGMGLTGMVAFTPGVSRSGGFVVGVGDTTSFTDSAADNSGSFEIGFDVPGQLGAAGSSVFAGTNLVCLGDSMTEGNTYPDTIAERLGLSTIECGFGGSQLTYDPTNDADRCGLSIVKIAEAIASGDWTALTTFANGLGNPWAATAARLAAVDWTTISYITIFIGTNDYGAGQCPLGATTSTNQAEFNGAWNYVIPTILAAKPWVKLVAITPTYRSRFVSGDGHDSDTYANSQGLVLPQYADATIDRAKARHIPVLDLNRTSGINASTASYYLVDGLHQNTIGDPLLGGKIAAFLAASF